MGTTEMERSATLCRNELCSFGELSPAWNFCPACGKPATEPNQFDKTVDIPLILRSDVAYLAISELDPYEFKLFMYIYFETAARGLMWKRIRQEDLEKDCDVSHPKVLKTIKLLRGDKEPLIPAYESGNATEDSELAEYREAQILHWIISDKRTEGWTKKQGYGLHRDLDDHEIITERLTPYREAIRKRYRGY